MGLKGKNTTVLNEIIVWTNYFLMFLTMTLISAKRTWMIEDIDSKPVTLTLIRWPWFWISTHNLIFFSGLNLCEPRFISSQEKCSYYISNL